MEVACILYVQRLYYATASVCKFLPILEMLFETLHFGIPYDCKTLFHEALTLLLPVTLTLVYWRLC